MMKFTRSILALTFLLLLSACGGGGGSAGNTSGGAALFTTAPSNITIGANETHTYTIGGGVPGYVATTSNSALKVSINGKTLTVMGNGTGSTTITVTDAKGDKVTIAATVGTGLPFAIGADSELKISVGGSSSNFALIGGSGVYTASSNNTVVATVTQSGNQFFVTGISSGIATITLADSLGATKSIKVTVGSSAPFFVTAPLEVQVAIGADSSNYQIGGGDQNYSVNSSNRQVATVTKNGSQLFVTGVSLGTAKITVSDGTGASKTFDVKVDSGRLFTTAPQNVDVGVGARSAVFTIGGGSLSYTVASGDTQVATVSQTGNTFYISGISPGVTDIQVTDSTGANNRIVVIVKFPVAFFTNAPTSLTVGVGLNSASYQIGGGSQVYFVSSNNTQVVTVTQIASTFFLTGVGAGTATVSVTDSFGAKQSLNVTVGTGSDLFISAPTDITVGVGANSSTFDIGGGTLIYSVSSSNPQIATVTLTGSKFYVTGVAFGKVVVSVTDSLGTRKSVNVTVGTGIDLFTNAPPSIVVGLAVNSANYQVGGGSPPYSISSGNSQVATATLTGNQFFVTGTGAGVTSVFITDSFGISKKIDVSVGTGVDLFTTAPSALVVKIGASTQVYTIGGGSLIYSIFSSNTMVATVGIAQNGKDFVITGQTGGNAIITIKDSAGKSTQIDVAVGSGNAIFSSAPDSVVVAPAASGLYKVGGGTSIYTVSSSNVTVATAVISGSDLTITGISSGVANVVVRDSIAGTLTIQVTVAAGPLTPLFTTSASDIVVVPATSPTYTIGGGRAPYAVSSSNVSVVTTSLSGATLTLNGIAAGAAKVVVSDSTGATVSINVTIAAGSVAALFTTAPVAITIATGAAPTYTIGGGKAPYVVTSSNAASATVTQTATTFTVTGVSAGVAQIVVSDSLGTTVNIGATVTSTAIAAVDVMPGDSTGATGDTLAYTITGGTSPFTVTNNNPSIATVVQSGASFTAKLLNVGATVVTVIDAQGQVKKITITATAANSLLRISPSTELLSEESTNSFDLSIYGGTAPYRVFTSDLSLSSVSVTGATMTVAVGSNGNRCVQVKDSSGIVVLGGSYSITLTVLDSLGASATNTFLIKDNFKGGVGCL